VSPFLYSLTICFLSTHAVRSNSLTKTEKSTTQQAFLRSLSSWQDYSQRLERLERHAGTCEWILKKDKFCNWEANPGFDLLFVVGQPGCGKSVIANYLCSYFQNVIAANGSPPTVLKFFCKNSSQQSSHTPIIDSFTYQLLDKFRPLFRHAFSKFRYDHIKNMYSVSPDTLYDLFQTIVLDPESGHLVFVIDGLDECSEPFTRSFLSLLEDLIKSRYGNPNIPNHSVKFLVTCQLVHPIPLWSNRYPSIEIQIEDTAEDVAAYVRHEVGIIAQARHFDRVSPGLKDTVIEIIEGKAKGMFLWVFYVLQNLKQMREATSETIKRTLESFPQDIDRFYSQSLRQKSEAFKRSPLETINPDTLLLILLFAMRPLRTAELTEFLAIDKKRGSWSELEEVKNFDIETLVRITYAPLVKVDNDIVDLAHHSVREFLLSLPLRGRLEFGLRRFQFHMARSHMKLAELCIHYLLMDDFRNLENLSDEKLESLPKKYQLLEYAANSWPFHLEHAKDEVVYCLPLLSRFLKEDSTHFRFWRKFYTRNTNEGPSSNERKPTVLTVIAVNNLYHLFRLSIGSISGIDMNLSNFSYDRAVSKLRMWLRSFILRRETFRIDEDVNEQLDIGAYALHLASRYGNIEIVKDFIKAGAPVNAKGEDGQTALHEAALRDEGEVAKALISAGADVEMQDDEGMRPLQVACMYGSHGVVEILLEAGADLCLSEPFSSSELLFSALGSRNEAIAVALLNASPGIVYSVNSDSSTLLKEAAICDFVVLCTIGLRSGLDPDHTDDRGFSPLQYAAVNGSTDTAEVLINFGADVNAGQPTTGEQAECFTPLSLAVKENHTDTACLLLDNGADHTVSDLGTHLIHYAASKGNIRLVARLLECGTNINEIDNNGKTALFLACGSESLETVQHILLRGANTTISTFSSAITPLHMAVWLGSDEIVAALLEVGAPLEAKSLSEGWTPLAVAAFRGHCSVISKLIQGGADLTILSHSKESLLYLAVKNNHQNAVKLLLANGVTTQRGFGSYWTPLHEAVWIGNSTIVESLLDNRADINCISNTGHTPLLGACFCGHLGLLNRLLERGADPSLEANGGISLLHAAASSGSANILERVIRLREEVEVRVDDADEMGWTPLHFACSRANTAVVRMLLKKQGNPKIKDRDSRTLLHKATSAGHLPVVRFLLNNTSLLDEQDSEGLTALSMACMGGFEAIVKELLAFGASPHLVTLKDNDGCLHFACRYGYHGIALSLINSKADINIRNLLGYTPLHEAILRHRRSTVQLLISRGAVVDSQLEDYLGRTIFDFSILHTFPESFSSGLSSIRTPPQSLISISYLVTTIHNLIKELDVEAFELPIPSPIVYKNVAKCLQYLNDESFALRIFKTRVCLPRNNSKDLSWFLQDDCVVHDVTCDNHMPTETIKGERYICNVCDDMDMCADCIDLYKHGQSSKHICSGHTWAKLSGSGSDYMVINGRKNYQDYVRKLLAEILHKYTNVVVNYSEETEEASEQNTLNHSIGGYFVLLDFHY